MRAITGHTAYAAASSARAKSGAVTLSTGRVIVVIPRDNTHFGIYETVDRLAWTTRGTPAVTALQTNPMLYSVELGHDETYIQVTYYCTGNSVRSFRITIATWAVSAEEVVLSPAANILQMDSAISETGAVMVALFKQSGSDIQVIAQLRTTVNTWVAGYSQTTTPSGGLKDNASDISVAWRKGSLNTARRFVIAMSYAGYFVDGGLRLYHGSINETSGASASVVVGNVVPYAKLPSGFFSFLFQYNVPPRRSYLFTDANNGEVYLATLTREGESKTRLLVALSHTLTSGANAAADTYSFSANETVVDGTMDLYTVVTFGQNDTGRRLINMVNFNTDVLQASVFSVISVSATGAVEGTIQSGGDWDYQGVNPRPKLLVGSSSLPGSVTAKKHDIVMLDLSNNPFLSSVASPVIVDVDPSPGETVASSTPTMTMRLTPPRWKRKPPIFRPKFEVATNVGFTAGLATFTDPVFHNYGAYSTTNPTVAQVPWGAAPIASGAWYLRGKAVDIYGNESAYFANPGVFTISHPMNASNILPAFSSSAAGATVVPYSDPSALGYSLVQVSWTPVDAWGADHQTSSRIIVTDTVTASVISDTGKIANTANTALIQVPVGSKAHFCTFSVELWDAYDQSVAPGGPQQYGSFISYDTPAITDFHPTTVDGGGFVNSSAPQFAYAITPSIYPTDRLDVEIKTGDTVVYSGTLANPGTAGIFSVGAGVLAADKNYTATAYARDTYGLTGVRSSSFTTKWLAPVAASGVAVSLDYYNEENESYTRVSWSNDNQDADFVNWNIYRRIDQVAADGVTPTLFGELELIGTDFSSDPTHVFRDYFAASGTRVGYLIRQVVSRFGALVESINVAMTYVYPVSEGYWLIDPTPEDDQAASFQLHNVTADSYTHEYEEQMIQIIGKGRHLDRGDDLGINGTMTCQFRHTGGTTARDKKLRMEQIKSEARSLFLRTPFGDTWFVSIGQVQVSRIAGVGLSEFCDVTIPYTEVYQ